MIILNACKDVKIEFMDDQSLLLFSPRVLTQSEEPDLCVLDNVLMEKKMDHFLSGFSFSWIWSEDKTQIYGLTVDADKDVCRDFLSELLGVDGKILLEDE